MRSIDRLVLAEYVSGIKFKQELRKCLARRVLAAERLKEYVESRQLLDIWLH